MFGYLSETDYALWATRTIGHYDFSVELEVPNAAEFQKFVREFREKFHGKMKWHDSFMVSEEIALSYFPKN